jgi:hypothetical protein
MKHLAQHFRKAARHHTRMAEEHHALHQLHKAHAAHHEGEGDHIAAGHHREVATRHAQLAKLHTGHADHLAEMAADHNLALDPEPDVFETSTGKLSDGDFFKSMLGGD